MQNKQKQNIQILANGQGIFFEKNIKKYLYGKYKIVCKNIGIDKSTKNMKDFIIQPYLIDKLSMYFLIQNQVDLFETNNLSSSKKIFDQLQNSLELRVFKALKQNYFLIDGHKFGSNFLAYDENPDKNHAKALIFCGSKDQEQSNFNHMTRLAQIAKKQCLFAYLDEQNQKVIFKKLERQKKQKTKRQNKKQKVSVKNQEKGSNFCIRKEQMMEK